MDDYVRRVFAVLFDDNVVEYLNFPGVKNKVALAGTSLYGAISGIFVELY